MDGMLGEILNLPAFNPYFRCLPHHLALTASLLFSSFIPETIQVTTMSAFTKVVRPFARASRRPTSQCLRLSPQSGQ